MPVLKTIFSGFDSNIFKNGVRSLVMEVFAFKEKVIGRKEAFAGILIVISAAVA
jgi:hypothetical protein